MRPNLKVANNLAWILATHPSAEIRNGEEAVRLAEAVCQDNGLPNPSMLDTLVASYAEVRRFADPVGTIQKALTLAKKGGMTKLAEQMQGWIQRYVLGKAYRDQ